MSETAEKEQTQEQDDPLREPPYVDVPRDHALWPAVAKALREIYDPEIPVNIYELGLIYSVRFLEADDEEGEVEDGETGEGQFEVQIQMSLTSPACPVAQEMPAWIQGALMPIEEVAEVDVEIVWDPTWTPAMMAETAKMELNMFM